MKIADLKARRCELLDQLFSQYVPVGSPLQIELFWGSQPKTFGIPLLRELKRAKRVADIKVSVRPPYR